MATIEYTCEACDAAFHIDPTRIPEGEVVMCPECGETEIIHVTGAEEGCSCQVLTGSKKRT